MKYPILPVNYKGFPVNQFLNCESFVNLPFLIETDKWISVNNLQDADIIPLKFRRAKNLWATCLYFLRSEGIRSSQILMPMLIYNDDDTSDYMRLFDEYVDYMKANSDYKIVLLHNNNNLYKGSKNYSNLIYYDHLFNRQKVYFTDFDKIQPQHKIYTNSATKACFKLNPICKTGDLSERKIFLTPNRIYHYQSPRMQYRKILKLLLENRNGYMSDPANSIILDPEEIDVLREFTPQNTNGGGGWYPLANRYYETSYISIYVESIVNTFPSITGSKFNFQSITEKTYDPLIKGHFILPFGYKGIINDLKNMGFLMPDWIDYSYDNISLDIERFAVFCGEIKRLLNVPIEKLDELYYKDQHLLAHNRELFFTKSYYPLHSEIHKYLNAL